MKLFKILLSLFLLILVHNFAISADFSLPTTWQEDKNFTKILKDEPILDIKNMRDFLVSLGRKVEFDGNVKLITLQNGMRAVFKVDNDDLGDAYAEVVAYRASKFLGFPFVPPTVIRKIDNQIGSLQLYVETDIDLLKNKEYQRVLSEVNEEDLANLFLFYFVFGQWDTGAHNLLALKKDKLYLIAIDNSALRNHIQVNSYGDLPFVRVQYSEKLNTNDWHKTFPFQEAKTLPANSSEEELRNIFENKVPQSFYNRFKNKKYPLQWVAYKKSIWIQYHAGDTSFVRSFTKYLPLKAIKKFKELNLKNLAEMYNFPNKPEGFNKELLLGILKRRDMVVEYYNRVNK